MDAPSRCWLNILFSRNI
ncbi:MULTISPECIES: YsgD/CorL family protein [Pantoea]